MGFMNATRGLRTTHLDSLAKGGVILKNCAGPPPRPAVSWTVRPC